QHITPDNPLVTERINAMKAGLLSVTTDADKATHQALEFLNITVNRQAAILSYIDIFHYLTLFIVVSVPLVLFAKTYKINKDMMEGH
ncbi:MAG TPA: hypothetical protein PLL59_05015, partial [Chitinophagales bacterium]|nr:hypothetical protein [Chitinophagales bacterium]